MFGSLLLLLSTFILFVSYMLFRKAAGTMSIFKPNIVSVTFYLWLFAMCFVGINLYLLGIDNYLLRKATQRSVYKAYATLVYVMITMPTSMVIYQRFFFKGNIKYKIDNFYTKDLVPLQSLRDSALVIFWLGITIICAASTMYTYAAVQKVPILKLIAGSPLVEVARLRHIATFKFPGNVYIKNLLSIGLTPIVSYIAYGYYRLYRNWLYAIWFGLTFILSILALTFTVEKAPVVIYVVTLLLISAFTNHGMSYRLLIIGFLTGVLMIVGLYYILGSRLSISLYSGLVSRMVMVPIAALPLTFDIFPEMRGFLHGASFPEWFVSIFGCDHIRSARVVMEMYNPSGVVEETAGVINTLFVAEAWANFGIIGMLISPFVVGFVIQFLHNFLSAARKTPMSMALMAYFVFKLPILGGFVDFVWNVGWYFLFLVILTAVEFRYAVLNFRPTRS